MKGCLNENEGELCIRELQAFHESLDREKGFDLDMLRNVAYLSAQFVISRRLVGPLHWRRQGLTLARNLLTVWRTFSSWRTMGV